MERPLRLLVVLPSWVGDAVMATPALRLLRDSLKGSFIGALARPGIDDVLAGTGLFDQVHVERARGVMGPKNVAAKIRPMRYGAALLLTNSFSTALITRLAFIPRRIGYDRDARGLLLTERLQPARRQAPHHGFAPVPAVEYYLRAARAVVGGEAAAGRPLQLELATSAADEAMADEMLRRATPPLHTGPRPLAVLNPGANNEAKRWPGERFARIGSRLATEHGMNVVVTGAPAEAELCEEIAAESRRHATDAAPIASLAAFGGTLGALKAVVRRCAIMVTNDTGPRHIAAAFGVPRVVLFGPTDRRWTTLPHDDRAEEREILADPTLPDSEVADDHPERCRIDRIEFGRVAEEVDCLLAGVRRPDAPIG
ncbi:MAG: glycosyltransferase family 9 protein [Phycisphaeraceae bacterium]|nr:glycosyltransferase family 9 protein [Phycisphaeraceae bacterium]